MVLDYTTNLHYFWALLPEFLLCGWGMVILLMGVSGKRDPRKGGDAAAEGPSHDLGLLTLVGILLAALANGWLYGVTESGHGLVTVDRFRLFANWIFLAAAVFGIVMAFTYVYRQRLQAGEFYSLILFATAGMMMMAAARDLIVIFLGLEVMSISVYALSAFNRRDRRSAEAGLKYFLLGAFSTGFF
ncbi:MAG TPA: proton-conducting transporter membrane subunit, partial [Longimicrobiales bacterium]|nr:proton-conducting transporter membrane subunit [Longimicrobiales bacterium]